MDKKSQLKKNVFRESEEVKGVVVKGYDFNKGVDYQKIVESFATNGFQATHFSRAVDVVNTMIKEHAFIYLGYTSSMVSSGLRETFRWLIEHKKVNVVVTTAGGIEEDIIKCLGNFVIGDFRADGAALRKKGINRIGNIFVPNSRYVRFEEFFQPLLAEMLAEQKKTDWIFTPSDIVWKLGEKINNKESICYWAWKNKIPVYCPALTDGALGDNMYFFTLNNPEFKLDINEDAKRLNDTTLGLKKSGVIILGAGVVKHHILNANMLRNGAEYGVYINTAQEYDGSDAGALPEEAISWGKLAPGGTHIKVFADATLVFPLLVAGTFAKK